jgi:hypothetical protein
MYRLALNPLNFLLILLIKLSQFRHYSDYLDVPQLHLIGESLPSYDDVQTRDSDGRVNVSGSI